MEELKLGILAGVGSLLVSVGSLDWGLVLGYMVLMTADLITGWYKAVKTGEFKSGKMKIGLLGKVAETVVVFALILLQKILARSGMPILGPSVILVAFAAKEAFSVVENWIQAGNKLPNKMQQWLDTVKKQIDADQKN